jgi:tRNA pseudouridine32 synthase/23S rRNA pseudouridine746 synthase
MGMLGLPGTSPSWTVAMLARGTHEPRIARNAIRGHAQEALGRDVGYSALSITLAPTLPPPLSLSMASPPPSPPVPRPAQLARSPPPPRLLRPRNPSAAPPTMTIAAGASLPSATWSVVHCDEAVLVVDKGCGLLTVPGIGPEKADCLLARVTAAGYPEVRHAPHRLDRDTSGLVALGRCAAAHKALAAQFQDRRVTKRYLALVIGWPEADKGEVSQHIGKVRLDGESHARMRVVPAQPLPGQDPGRLSLTRWRVLEQLERPCGTKYARVELEPVTGRAHQLRLAMESIGHPILGDELHGSAEAVAAEPRLCLHAALLEFAHPMTNKRISVQAPAPF